MYSFEVFLSLVLFQKPFTTLYFRTASSLVSQIRVFNWIKITLLKFLVILLSTSFSFLSLEREAS